MNTKTITLSALALAAGSALAAPVEIQVSVENLAPQNSVAFAPLRVGFHSGSYDSFDEGPPPGPRSSRLPRAARALIGSCFRGRRPRARRWAPC
ncbi:MAG: hypothetical protein R3B67_08775 [Phycisphaerales bacterium]